MKRYGGILGITVLSAALLAPASLSTSSQPAAAASLGSAPAVTLTSGAKVGAVRERITGSTPYDVAAAISRRAYPDAASARTVYLIGVTTSLDGIAAGALHDGPVLPVPADCGTVPRSVADEIERLDPDQVVAVGRTTTVCDQQLKSAAGGRTTARIAHQTARSSRLAAIAQRAYPDGASTVYLVRGTLSSSLITAGTLPGPLLALSEDGTVVPSPTADAITTLKPRRVVALGSSSMIPDATLAKAAAGRTSARISGKDTSGMSVAIAKEIYPTGHLSRMYLSRSDSWSHAQALGMLHDGPVLLTPGSYSAVNSSVKWLLGSRTPNTVIAIGSTSTLSDSSLIGASNAARGPVDCAVTKCVAVTFDDGPGDPSTTVLSTLASYRVPATFFTVGQRVAARPSTVKRQYVEGHTVANHTWDHPQLSKLSLSSQKSQVSRTATAIVNAGAPKPTLLRPPYGAYNTNTRYLGYPLIIWDVDPEDWKSITSAEVRRRVVEGTRNGSVVLMHDIHWRTSNALPGILSDLIDRGYTLVSPRELVPTMKNGDLVYRRDLVKPLSTAFTASSDVITPDGRNLGPALDEAPIPGLAPSLSTAQIIGGR